VGVVYFSIIPTFEPSRYCKCWIVCFYNKNPVIRDNRNVWLRDILITGFLYSNGMIPTAARCVFSYSGQTILPATAHAAAVLGEAR
jgi:hypothetical protein